MCSAIHSVNKGFIAFAVHPGQPPDTSRMGDFGQQLIV
jgi:hypothetical protein